MRSIQMDGVSREERMNIISKEELAKAYRIYLSRVYEDREIDLISHISNIIKIIFRKR